MIKTAVAGMGELLCPHSAVGVHVAQNHLGATPMITLATAHPAKFPAAVKDATGVHPELPPRMGDLFDRDERMTELPGDVEAIKALIRERIAS
jgi:threonine synthase